MPLHLGQELRPIVGEVGQGRLLQIAAQGRARPRRTRRIGRLGNRNALYCSVGVGDRARLQRTVRQHGPDDTDDQEWKKELPLVQFTHNGQPQKKP
jgi:hypothetical protein